jgi:hypothetical protein
MQWQNDNQGVIVTTTTSIIHPLFNPQFVNNNIALVGIPSVAMSS